MSDILRFWNSGCAAVAVLHKCPGHCAFKFSLQGRLSRADRQRHSTAARRETCGHLAQDCPSQCHSRPSNHQRSGSGCGGPQAESTRACATHPSKAPVQQGYGTAVTVTVTPRPWSLAGDGRGSPVSVQSDFELRYTRTTRMYITWRTTHSPINPTWSQLGARRIRPDHRPRF